MKFKIHFTLPDDTEDFVVIEGDTLEAVRDTAREQISLRGGINPWSEKLND